MRVEAQGADGQVVKSCNISDDYKKTNVYTMIKAGDASTHGGTVVRWQFIDRAERVVEEIAAPDYR